MRYAIYFTPAIDHPLTIAAGRWLGYDAFAGEERPFPDSIALPSGRMSAVTAAAARYGFHATLKAPFRLADNTTPAALEAAFDVFCRKHGPFDIPELKLGKLGRFHALVPARENETLRDFAADVVRYFEPMRAPLANEEIARRKPDDLSDEERDNLERWGYPYVFDAFRFHMTLTGPVSGTDAHVIETAIEDYFAPFVGEPLEISGIGLFMEERRGAPFTIRRWQPLTGGQSRDIGAGDIGTGDTQE
ncbi:DUF1045 domain-containing protein [Martelella soudanensis]|uniref:DUF1045 domain-containing protein n=1 Tax=unclassified Martelella TaxID=2629616 RepID=UPI0015E00E6C|nr:MULTISPECIES: DUF1045 domain-containing protein [unclassified Martelella]